MPDTRINAATPTYNQGTKSYLTTRQIKQKSATLEGVVVNNFIKEPNYDEKPNLDDTYNTLLISDNEDINLDTYIPKQQRSDEYNTKKAMLPLVLGTLGVFAASAAMGLVIKKSAKDIVKQPFKNRLPDMGLNLNIKQEHEFATYMALRDPTKTNVMAAIAVLTFSAITLVGKKFVEGVKEIWVKKQDADIQRDLQENLIEVETQAFSGKLAVVRNMLSKKGHYFKTAINGQNQKQSLDTSIYTKHFNFMGSNEKEKNEKKEPKIKKLLNPYVLISAATLAAGIGAGVFTYKNFKKSNKIITDFETNFTNKKEKILKDIIEGKSANPVDDLKDTLIKMGANKEAVKEHAKKIGLDGKELEDFVNSVASDVNTIWGNAPTGMSTESGKSFFYCYLDEVRGHLYNWITHSDNVFLKHLFFALATVSGASYLGKETADAMKQAAVLKENAKTNLDLQKRLVEVEINNFKAKKDSAVKPLIEEFERQRKEGKSPEELKVMADNVLLEIKNGPPFVYS